MFKKKEIEKEAEPKAKPAAAAAAVIEAMPDPLLVLNLDGEILSVNSAHLKLFGHKSPDEITGKSFEGMRNAFINPEEDIPKMLELFGEVIEKGFTERPIELNLQRPDGSKQFTVSASGSIIRDVDGKPMNVVAVLRDITELKRAEEERVAALKRAADVMESIADSVWVIDLEGRIAELNEATASLVGFTKDELIGNTFSLFATGEEVEKAFKGMESVVKEGILRDYPINITTKDKRTIPVLFSGSLIRDEKGEPKYIIGAARDVTELKRAEEKRIEAEKKAARAEEAEKYSKELEKKIRDLERFQKVTMDREKRVLELKKDIKELKKQLEVK